MYCADARAGASCRPGDGRGVASQIFRQVVHMTRFHKRHRMLDGVFELADVARPLVTDDWSAARGVKPVSLRPIRRAVGEEHPREGRTSSGAAQRGMRTMTRSR
jgi:hypothetical protein